MSVSGVCGQSESPPWRGADCASGVDGASGVDAWPVWPVSPLPAGELASGSSTGQLDAAARDRAT